MYEFGVDQGYHYIAMRYVKEGKTLSRLMRQTLDQARAIELIAQIGGALAYAHKKGVIHRDVKPSNVLVVDDWPLLSDFGLAKINGLDRTATGISWGTPAYMAPEQARSDTVDHRVDIYALGIILYEMLTGCIPHQDKADTPYTILHKRCTQPPGLPRRLNPEISEAVEQVMLRALATKPEERYHSAADFVTALQNAEAGGIDIEATAPSPRPRLVQGNPAYSQNFLLTGAILGVIIMSGLGGWIILNSISTEQSSAQTDSRIAVLPEPTVTVTPTPFPTQTAMPDPTSSPPTATPPSPLPTATPPLTSTIPPTLASTARSIFVPPPATETSPPTAPPFPTTVPTTTPTSAIPAGTFTLLKPLSCDEPSYGLTDFEWTWSGPVPPQFGFEVRIWREGEPPTGVHNSILDNKEGRVEQLGDNKYRLIADITETPGVNKRPGEYRWTVLLVQIDPTYDDSQGQQAQPACVRFEAGGRSGGDGGSGSGGPIIHDPY